MWVEEWEVGEKDGWMDVMNRCGWEYGVALMKDAIEHRSCTSFLTSAAVIMEKRESGVCVERGAAVAYAAQSTVSRTSQKCNHSNSSSLPPPRPDNAPI